MPPRENLTEPFRLKTLRGKIELSGDWDDR